MESSERSLIEELSKENFLLMKLYREHEELEGKLSKYGGKPFLTSEEEVEQKRLKTTKLRGMDRMMSILSSYKRVN